MCLKYSYGILLGQEFNRSFNIIFVKKIMYIFMYNLCTYSTIYTVHTLHFTAFLHFLLDANCIFLSLYLYCAK